MKPDPFDRRPDEGAALWLRRLLAVEMKTLRSRRRWLLQICLVRARDLDRQEYDRKGKGEWPCPTRS